MEIRQLRYFVTVVDCGSLTRAASTLHVVQSALSQQMMQLEAELGTPLLLRSVRGVQVTEAGSTFYRHAQGVLKQVENARNAVLGATTRGPVAIGIPNGSSGVVAAPLLERILHEFPEVRPAIIEAHSGQLVEMLANGRLDFSFVYHTNFLHGFETDLLLSEPLCLLAPESIPIPGFSPRSESVALTSLADIPMILPGSANATRVLLDQECKRSGISLRVVAEAAALPTLQACVAAGLGCTVLVASNFAGMPGAAPPRLAPVIEPVIERRTLIARSREFPVTQTAKAIYELTQQVVVDLVKGGQWVGARLIA